MGTLKVGIVAESAPGERRVAMTPSAIGVLNKTGAELLMEPGAGLRAGFPDAEYTEKGVRLAAREEVFGSADVLIQVRAPGANPEAGAADLALMRRGQIAIGFGEPLTALDAARALAGSGVSFMAMELMPRITRAQSMDALSSMATIAGYKAVLIAANSAPRMFPMLMTAAGTVAPARVLILGAGVAGLQAIATARRLGAVVSGYDIRSAVREQIESLGARFVVLDVEAAAAEDKGGYAKAMGEDFYRRQREAMAGVLAQQNVVVTTAAVPGKKAPVLITREMAERMAPGSVIVDIAAERGGNCELTRPGETVEHQGVEIHGPLNLASTIPYHASQMYAKNIATFLKYLIKDGQVNLNREDEIVRGTLVTHAGEIVHAQVLELMELSMSNLEIGLWVFMLATFVGLEVIRKVSPLLHTPLMSLTNAISAISVVGAIMITGSGEATTLSKVLGFIAITAAVTNIVSGYLITDRMLKMFKRRPAAGTAEGKR